MEFTKKVSLLSQSLEHLYSRYEDQLPFHGWHHVVFVQKKAVEFAKSIGADVFLVESSALVHDMNYLVVKGSRPSAGYDIRRKYLEDAGYGTKEVARIENIIIEADIKTRTNVISSEGKALSDADTLFKVLPITPIIFSSRHISENNVNIYKLANRIAFEQGDLLERGIYFYTDLAKSKYLEWAKMNLKLWMSVVDSLQDEDIKELLRMIGYVE